ncbi:MAG: EAL domain-containing protein [Oscillospiraceae bacterium]
MSLKEKKKLFFAVLAAAVFILLSVLYAQYITNLLTKESRMHLAEVATQGAASVQRQIARDFDILEVLADGLISNPNISLEDKVARIKQQADKFGLYRIAIVDLDGNAIASDNHAFSVADREFFQTAVKGRRCLSEPIIDKVDRVTPGIVYAVPVRHGGKVVGVLFSGYELEKLTQRIDISFYHESGLAFIVDADGNVLLHPVAERIGANIAEIAQTRNSAAVVEDFKNNLKNAESGVSHLVMRTENRFFAYAPIEGANDWFLFTSLPAKAVFERSQKVIFLTILLLVGISVVLTSTGLYITMTKRKANAKIVKLAYYDRMTGAPNVECFKMEAQALLRQFGAPPYRLLNFDVTQFRTLNHNLGYDAGNALLVHIVHCLANVARKGEVFARIGIDQFLLLFSAEGGEQEALLTVKRLREQIAAWELPTGEYYCVQLAFGMYEIEACDTDMMLMIERSNIARKAVKNDHEGDVAIYNASMQERIDRCTELENAMPAALENGEFKLFIQPKYDLLTEKIVGGEALVRWIKADGTVVLPDEFIPLFEQTGAIAAMDLHMLEQLCRFLRTQLDSGLHMVPISINQSRRYMYGPTYVEIVCGKLRQNGVPSRMIELEITENLAYTELDKLIGVLDRLHQEGFRISLDDFGSGYSSLNMLKDLPVDILKLDRFMLGKTMHSQREKTVVANIIRMAKELNMSVVAEGVETREQVLFLRDCGCEMAQGYYYSKPVPATRFQQLLHQEQPEVTPEEDSGAES